MNLTILNSTQVRALLPMASCIELMAAALSDLAAGRAAQPLRTMMPLHHVDRSQKGVFGVMPAESHGRVHAHGLKAVNILPENQGTAHDAHQGLVLLFEPEFGRPAAVLDASALTAIRTAAVSAVATRCLANEDADTLAILGAGVQARSHIEAMVAVRPIRKIQIWNRTRTTATTLAEEIEARYGIQTVVSTAEAAVRESQIVCAVTGAATPVVQGVWLQQGAHVNLVGSSSPTRREADTALMAQPRLFTDSTTSLRAEAGDYLLAAAEDGLPPDQELVELGAVLLGDQAGRTHKADRTVFKALGLGVEDITAGWHCLEGARKQGLGTSVPFGNP